MSQRRYHAGVANNRFIGCLVGLLLLYMASFASRLPTRSNPSINKKRETQTTSVCISLFWRRLRDSNPRGFCPNGFQDRLVMTASISLRLFGFFLRLFASLQCLCFRIFCGEKVVVVCCRATFTFARLSNYILFFRKNQLFFSENYCFPNFSVFRLFLSLVCVRI